MKCICFLMVIATLSLTSCNEPGRGQVNEVRNEAAAESNKDKFEGKKQRDADFVYEVIEANYSEIKLAELGNQRLRTPGVKKLSEMIQEDRTSFLNQLKVLAQAKAISVPVEETEESRRKMEELAEESADDFDKAWRKEMIDLYDKNIRKFEKRLEDTADEELKALLNETLPVMKKRRASLEALSKESKG